MLDKPENLRLYGATPAEREQSRRENDVRIDFDPVLNADGYTGRLNGTILAGDVHSGDWITVGFPNTLAIIEVRAYKAGELPGPWSDPLSTCTRPPQPAQVSQLNYELSEVGIVIAWSHLGGFAGSAQAKVRLRRDALAIFEQVGLVGATLTRFTRKGFLMLTRLKLSYRALRCPMTCWEQTTSRLLASP